MSRHAFITLATNDTYCMGALVLAQSLRDAGTTKDIIALTTSEVSPKMRQLMVEKFDMVKDVDIIRGNDTDQILKTDRPEWAVCMTKILAWRLTDYDKIVYVDSDAVCLQNCDELFDYPELSAVPDMSWTDIFNSGVFVFVPSEKTYQELAELVDKGVSFDRADQGLLNVYFSNWFNEKEKHLSYIYNTGTLACFSYPQGYGRFGHRTKILHFLGGLKPWEFGYDPKTGDILDPPGVRPTTLQEHLQFWWKIFLRDVHPRLHESMTGLAGRLAQVNYKKSLFPGVRGLGGKHKMSHDIRMNFTDISLRPEIREKSIGG